MRSTRLLSSSKRLLGLDPLPVPPHAFSVDEGWLRYGRFVGADGTFDFQEFHEVALPPATFHPGPLGGTVKEPEALRERLQTLLEAVTATVADASLVLPDAWLRLTFAELEERPRQLSKVEDVLRWKLKKLVPFRVDELRLRGAEAAPLAGEPAGQRVLLGYAMEALLAQLESTFAQLGVRIGLTVNGTLALCAAFGRRAADQRFVFLHVSPSGYALVLAGGGRPLFHRFRALATAASGNGDGDLVLRDLRLTRDFLARELSGALPSELLVVAPPDVERTWRDWVGEAFECEVFGLRSPHLPLRGELAENRLPDVAPLLGAACHQV